MEVEIMSRKEDIYIKCKCNYLKKEIFLIKQQIFYDDEHPPKRGRERCSEFKDCWQQYKVKCKWNGHQDAPNYMIVVDDQE